MLRQLLALCGASCVCATARRNVCCSGVSCVACDICPPEGVTTYACSSQPLHCSVPLTCAWPPEEIAFVLPLLNAASLPRSLPHVSLVAAGILLG
jgi:hypothetical protein